MKRLIALLLACLLLTGCAPAAQQPLPTDSAPVDYPTDSAETLNLDYASAFDFETEIHLSDSGIDISGPNSDTVALTHDIIYYEDKDIYESGNPYGEGSDGDKHTAEEAEKYVVVNITAPGAYRVSGKLSAGQIRVDLGEDAYEDATARVELILDNVDITCTVAPAILFLNVYECDGNWSVETAKSEVDTSYAGANLILAEGSRNTVNGSYVARIYKDQEGEKKLWKQDGAVYSYMSMNVFGPGSLDVTAENEGLDTELHLTINGGEIAIRSGNDGINTNEDGVSVTTINGGNLHIIAGLGEEGDGVDSNGYLVINGGTVIASANPAADAGLDSDLGSYVNGGTVIALGSTMDWAESDSNQVTMNLQFASYRESSDAIVITKEDGSEVFSYNPAADAIVGENARRYMGAVISCAEFAQGETYQVYVNGDQMMYTGTDVRMRPGAMGGGFGDRRPNGAQQPELPAGETMPEGWTPGERGERPEGFGRQEPPEGQLPTWPEGEMSSDWEKRGESSKGFGKTDRQNGEGNSLFYMQDKVNCFSGLTAVSE